MWDEKGRLRTHAPSTYKIPASGDCPRDLQRRAVREREPRGHDPPLQGGRRAAADAGDLGAPRAADAVASVADYRVCPRLDAPATPERVLEAVERLRAEAGSAGAGGVTDRLGRAPGPAARGRHADRAGRRWPRPRARRRARRGRRCWSPTSAAIGTIGGGRLEWEALAQARKLLAGGQAEAWVEIPLGPAVGQCCGGHVRIRLRRAGARELAELEAAEAAAEAALPTVLLFGAGHVGRALAAALAPLPLRLRWIDARAGEFPAEAPPGVEVVVTDRPLAEIEQAAPGGRGLRPDPQPQPRLHAVQRRPRARRLRLSRPDRLGDQAARSSSAAFASWASRRSGSPPWSARSAARPARQAAGGDRRPGRRRAAASACHTLAPPRRRPRKKGPPSMTDGSAVPLRLELRGITKRFPGVVANSDVALHGGAGRDPRASGRERRRQDHAGQDHLRRARTPTRARCSGTASPSGWPTPRRRGRSASAWCSSTSRCSRR